MVVLDLDFHHSFIPSYYLPIYLPTYLSYPTHPTQASYITLHAGHPKKSIRSSGPFHFPWPPPAHLRRHNTTQHIQALTGLGLVWFGGFTHKGASYHLISYHMSSTGVRLFVLIALHLHYHMLRYSHPSNKSFLSHVCMYVFVFCT